MAEIRMPDVGRRSDVATHPLVMIPATEFSVGTGSFHQSFQPFSPQSALDLAPRQLPIAIIRRRHRASYDPKPPRGRSDCDLIGINIVALWQHTMGGDARCRHCRHYDRRRRWRKRTPGPPPFSSMNSTPAASKARRTAKSLAVVIDVSSSVSSARRIVVTLKAVSRARSSALQRMRARAALIWALVSGFTALLTLSFIMLCFMP